MSCLRALFGPSFIRLKAETLIRVVVADDHPVVREGLRSTLPQCGRVEIVGEAEDGRQALEMVKRLRPDVILLDIKMPEINGLEATKEIQRAFPEVKVVILSMHEDHEYVRRLVDAGCRGYVLKDSSPLEVVRAIEKVHAGEMYLAGRLIPNLLHPPGVGAKSNPHNLTPREIQVLTHVANGLTNKETGIALKMATRTVEKHRQNVMDKTGCTTVAQLVRYALAQGYVKLN